MKSAKLVAALTASALLISPSFASEVTPLPVGKPAGTQQAALLGTTVGLLVSLAAAAAGIAYAAGAFNSSSSTTGTGS